MTDKLVEAVQGAIYDQSGDTTPEGIIQAIRDAGWAVTPVQPTQKMLITGCERLCEAGLHAFHGDAEKVYKAMIQQGQAQ